MGIPEQSRISTAITDLTRADRIRLLRIAQRFAFGCALSPEDLFQEALTRALSGNRSWPEDVSFLGFLAGAMKSIAFDERKKTKTHPLDLAVSVFDHDCIENLQATGEDDCDDDSDQRIELLRSLFSQNENAALVFEYLLDGLKPQQIRDELGLTETEYDSARTYIRRRINSHFKFREQP